MQSFRMKFFITILFLIPGIGLSLTFKDGKQVDDSSTSININTSETVDYENKIMSFQPFDCKKLETPFLRVNNQNDCIIIQELSNEYEVKSHDVDPNTWNRSLLLRYIDNKDGEKIIAHTWNNVVKWGESSNKQPFSHLAVIDIPNLNEILKVI